MVFLCFSLFFMFFFVRALRDIFHRVDVNISVAFEMHTDASAHASV